MKQIKKKALWILRSSTGILYNYHVQIHCDSFCYCQIAEFNLQTIEHANRETGPYYVLSFHEHYIKDISNRYFRIRVEFSRHFLRLAFHLCKENVTSRRCLWCYRHSVQSHYNVSHTQSSVSVRVACQRGSFRSFLVRGLATLRGAKFCRTPTIRLLVVQTVVTTKTEAQCTLCTVISIAGSWTLVLIWLLYGSLSTSWVM